jgi:hypothetical protein
MRWFLVKTAYGTEVLWAGSTPEQACRNAEAVLGLPVVAARAVPTTAQGDAA